MSSEPIIYDASALLVPGFTYQDIHRRREGEPLGHVPRVGDVIRYAMRHGPWPAGAGSKRLPDWPARDAQGDWSEPFDVIGAYEQDGLTKYSLLPNRGAGANAWIDLDCWIAELVVGVRPAARHAVMEQLVVEPVVEEVTLW